VGCDVSGGSWDYAYRNFDEVSRRLLCSTSIRRRALGLQIAQIASAVKAVEWVDSSDWAESAEIKAIDAVLNPAVMRAALIVSIAELREQLASIEAVYTSPKDKP
jgi:hypothetical protein